MFPAAYVGSQLKGKIIEECKKFNLPAPVFTNEFSGLQVTFKNPKKKVSGKVSEKMSGKMSGKIIALVDENKNITIAELSKKIGVTERTVERNIQKLRTAKLLERIGGAKGGYWKVIDEN